MNKRVFVFGANGMLGTYVCKYLSLQSDIQVVPLTRDDFDITKHDIFKFHKLFDDNKVSYNDVVVNCAGIIKQRESDEFAMREVNTNFPWSLQSMSLKYGCPVIHITTDCVFSGDTGSYDETSPHDAQDEYGKSKSKGEPNLITNIRTSIIGEERHNKKSLLEWVKTEPNPITLYNHHLWNGVTCLQLAKYIYNIIKKGRYWGGTRHYFSEVNSKATVIELIAWVYGLSLPNMKYIGSPEHNLKKKDMTLSTIYSFPPPPTLNQQLLELKEFNICQNE